MRTGARLKPSASLAAGAFAVALGILPGTALAQDTLPSSPEHARLVALAGGWEVYIGSPSETEPVGTATARTKLGDRFLEIEVTAASAPVEHAIYTLAFDERHDEYAVILMDNYGTYFVTARGKADDDGDRVAMYGKDDDPAMTAMGLEKEFAVVLYFRDDGFALETRFIDTRTPERNEMSFLKFEFRRPDAP